jgi:hypothetical protein
MVKYLNKWQSLAILTATAVILSAFLNTYRELSWQAICFSLLFALLPILLNVFNAVFLFSATFLFGEKRGSKFMAVNIIKTVLLNNAILIPVFLTCIVAKYFFAADFAFLSHLIIIATKLILPLFLYIAYKLCMQTSWEESARIVSLVLAAICVILNLLNWV